MHPPAPVADPPGTRTDWTTWHLHIPSRARSMYDRVVLDVVGPAVAADDRPWFFLRYWQGGPHVRLRIGDLDAASRARCEEGLRERLAVAAVPREGEASLDAAGYREDATRLAATETDRPADAAVDELRPPGVHGGTYVPEVERYGGPALVPATERLFRLSSELALALIPHAPETRHRAVLAVRATVSAAAATGGARERERFYRGGLAFWRDWVAATSGIDAAGVDRLCDVPGPTGAGPDPDAHGPFAGWHAALLDLVVAMEEAGVAPGPVLLSHVHMFANRIGRSMVEEMQTYAWLAAGAGRAA